MKAVEQELIEEITRLNDEQQRKVLEFVRSIEDKPQEKIYTALELMKLPFEERNRIAIAALERSLEEDVELFEAF